MPDLTCSKSSEIWCEPEADTLSTGLERRPRMALGGMLTFATSGTNGR